jgi:hypothetical protein
MAAQLDIHMTRLLDAFNNRKWKMLWHPAARQEQRYHLTVSPAWQILQEQLVHLPVRAGWITFRGMDVC